MSRTIFGALRAQRGFERRHLCFLRTLEDRDLLYEIGYHQMRGKPLGLKQLLLLGIASVPTVQRRLRRLRQAGAIRQQRASHDRRVIEVTLAPRIAQIFSRYDELVEKDAPGGVNVNDP